MNGRLQMNDPLQQKGIRECQMFKKCLLYLDSINTDKKTPD